MKVKVVVLSAALEWVVHCTSVATAEVHWFLNPVDSLSLCINAFS